MTDAALGASFRDPSGFLFTHAGKLYRQVNQSYRSYYDLFFSSGLYDRLVSRQLLVPHKEANVAPATPEPAYKIIEPEKLAFISYPYEWSFSQYKDAALTTLRIQKIALEYGMSLKDASAYNIQFRQGKPLLIDTLSFEKYIAGRPWVAYRQFCQHFLAPLSLMAYRDIRLGQCMRVYIDGIPLDLASKLLPARTLLNMSLILHIHAHAASQKRYAAHSVQTGTQAFGRDAMLGLIDNLEVGIQGLRWLPGGTEWGDYYNQTNYSQAGLEHKETLIKEFIDQIRPHSLWDLGANTGHFSRLASMQGIPTIAFDIDPAAVEKNYRDTRSQKDGNLLPLLLDLTNPSPSIGWHQRERMSLLERAPADAVMALALIHHLAISNNVPLERIAQFFHEMGQWLIIEFVPKDDSQVQRLLATRQDIFPDYTFEGFEAAFKSLFKIHRIEPVQDSERRLYLMERLS